MDEQDEILDRQLRDAVRYIDDDGFASRVLQNLPPSRKAAQVSRGFILIGMAVLASVVAYLLGGRFINESIVRLANLPMMWLLLLTFTAGLLLGLGGLIAAIKSRELSL